MAYQVSRLPENDKFIAHMKQMEMNFAPEVIGGFIDIALQTVEDISRGNAPVLTGSMRDSIIHYMIDLMAGECIVGAPYGMPVEYGYMSRGGRRIPGKNFFRPAVQQGYKELLRMLKQFIGENAKGIAPTPSHRASASGKKGHKFIYKTPTAVGKDKYYYSPGTQVRRTTPLRRGPGKAQPSFGRVRGGRLPRRF